jgi:hypothetical protein
MSAFDRRVLEWLNDADLPEKSKTTVLNRTAAGIKTYRTMFENEPKLAAGLAVDFGLDDVVARAQRRLKDGETPIVVLPSQGRVPAIQLRPSASRASSRPATARGPATRRRTASAAPATQRTQARPATASQRAALVSKPTPIPKRSSYGTKSKPVAATA